MNKRVAIWHVLLVYNFVLITFILTINIFSVFIVTQTVFLPLACMHGYYGNDCTKKCGNCLNNETCNNINGTCTDGCSEGFKGDLCTTGTVKIEPIFKDSYLCIYFTTSC